MEQAKKDQIAFGKKFPFTFIYGERTIIEQVGHTVVQIFPKSNQQQELIKPV